MKMKVLIASGPTREPIDAVRYLSNYSTGYMGAALAREARRRGHRVTVVSGPVSEPLPAGVRRVSIERAADLARALRREAPRADAIVMAAAVADFRPVRRTAGKLRRAGRLTLCLAPTPDVIAGLPVRPGQVRAGFAIESRSVPARAGRKLREKRLDLVLAQRSEPTGAPFGRRPIRAWLLERGCAAEPLGRIGKPEAARRLFGRIEALWRLRHP
ncbi:MAG TPA: phosphopantothenoylcysteine decarboxylase [bacterium]